MGRQIYLSENELNYLKSLLDSQDPHDMSETNPVIAHYETSRLSLSKKICKEKERFVDDDHPDLESAYSVNGGFGDYY